MDNPYTERMDVDILILKWMLPPDLTWVFNLSWDHQYLYPASNINIKQPTEPISRDLKYFSLSSQEIDYFEVQELSTISQKVTIATDRHLYQLSKTCQYRDKTPLQWKNSWTDISYRHLLNYTSLHHFSCDGQNILSLISFVIWAKTKLCDIY